MVQAVISMVAPMGAVEMAVSMYAVRIIDDHRFI